MMMGFGIMGGLFMIIFWVGVTALVIWLVRVLFQGSGRQSGPTQIPKMSAQEILDRRYARGELSREEYELTKQDLAKGN